MIRTMMAAALLAGVAAGAVGAQERIDSAALAAIRAEGFERSAVLETAIRLSDVNGPRLAGTAGYLRAAEWARDRLTTWGLADARLEPWGRRGAGWELERFSVEMTAPWYLNLHAVPKAWSTSTAGVVRGTPVAVRIRGEQDFERYRGRLRGRIVLNGGLEPVRDRWSVPARRWTRAELDSVAALAQPGGPAKYWQE
jgi:carboxypeptidase Q